MAFISLAYVVVISLISCLFIVKQHQYHKLILEHEGEMNGFMFQLISGIAKIKNSAAENRAFFQWSRYFSRQQNIQFKMSKLDAGLATVNSIVALGATLLLFIGVGFLGVKLNAGQFVGFNAALGQFIAAFSALIMIVPDLLEIKPLYERVRPIIEETTETHKDLPPMEPLNGRIDVHNLCYRYPGAAEETLRNISLHARPGEFIALVGSSGSGKSTLLKLLLGFDRPSSGSIFFGNIDMQSRDVPSLRRQIGVVLQKSKIFPGSILENVIGNLPLSAEDAMAALEDAGFKDDLEELPMGLHTVIGDSGSLSGGQKQRVLIARALVNRPRVLYFDEATSALDNKTQKIVSGSLENLKATRIVIAHRLSTVQGADRIYVMDRGEIIEHGSYSELMVQKGKFYDLAKRQIA
jgi:ABC-type bacteriocin/lantibiotic exporter with double-glycine peptidase domain